MPWQTSLQDKVCARVYSSVTSICITAFCLQINLCSSAFFPCKFLDLRVAVLGNVDSGKSTLLGVLTQGELDNGRGRARLNLFRHLHEIQSGRTSSISFEILGFNSKGEVWVSGCLVSSYYLTLLDTKDAFVFVFMNAHKLFILSSR